MIVVDASVVAPALCDDGRDGDRARGRLRGEALAAPELLDVEVLSVWRRQRAAGLVDERRIQLAVDDLDRLPVQRASHRPLLRRCWQLRDDLTAYDAVYVALAEALGATLVTADRRLERAPGIGCNVDVLS